MRSGFSSLEEGGQVGTARPGLWWSVDRKALMQLQMPAQTGAGRVRSEGSSGMWNSPPIEFQGLWCQLSLQSTDLCVMGWCQNACPGKESPSVILEKVLPIQAVLLLPSTITYRIFKYNSQPVGNTPTVCANLIYTCLFFRYFMSEALKTFLPLFVRERDCKALTNHCMWSQKPFFWFKPRSLNSYLTFNRRPKSLHLSFPFIK